MNYPEYILRITMRKLFSLNVLYMRLYIISAISDLRDIDFIAKRLLSNQKQIANYFKPFYGEENSKILEDLLKENILMLADFISKTITNKIEESVLSKKNLYDNAEEISQFLIEINSSLSTDKIKELLRDLLFDYLDLIEKEFINRYHRSYKEDIEIFDEAYDQILEFSDKISDLIIKNKPDKFSTSKFDHLLKI